MPSIYQAYYRGSKSGWYRHHGTSRVSVEAEARRVAKTTGMEVFVDVLGVDKPSMKSLIELLNTAQPKSRKRLCSFVPKGSPVNELEDGEIKKTWRVKKKTS
jgi:hypothetical protein